MLLFSASLSSETDVDFLRSNLLHGIDTPSKLGAFSSSDMARKQSKTFTEKETQIMRVFWERGESTVWDVLDALGNDRPYNSILTIIRVLQRKGHLKHRRQGRGYVYRVAAPQEKSKARVLARLIDDLFDGSRVSLLLNLVQTGGLTIQELDTVRRKLNKLLDLAVCGSGSDCILDCLDGSPASARISCPGLGGDTGLHTACSVTSSCARIAACCDTSPLLAS
jgi:BlaI family penicillinase repressor